MEQVEAQSTSSGHVSQHFSYALGRSFTSIFLDRMSLIGLFLAESEMGVYSTAGTGIHHGFGNELISDLPQDIFVVIIHSQVFYINFGGV
jgi:hypothetical protein